MYRAAVLLILLGCASAPAVPPTPTALDKEQIRLVIQSHRDQIRACYEDELEHAPDLAGKIVLRFVIEASGVVGSAAASSSTMASPAVETCLAERVKTWTFPPPKGGGKVVVAYPFIFSRPAR